MKSRSFPSLLSIFLAVSSLHPVAAKEIQSFKFSLEVRCVVFSPDGKSLAIILAPADGVPVAAGAKPEVVVWDVADRKERLRLAGHIKTLECATFSPDSQMLAVGAQPKGQGVELWDLGGGQSKLQITTRAPVSSLSFGADGKTLAVGTRDDTVRLLDAGSGQEIRTWRVTNQETNAKVSVAFSPDGARLAVGSALASDGFAFVYDPASGEQVARFPAGAVGPAKFGIQALQFFADGKRIAIAAADLVSAWDIKVKNELAQSPKEPNLRELAVTLDGALVATAGSAARTGGVHLWQFSSTRVLETFDKDHQFHSLAFSPNGKLLAGGCHDGTVKIWDVSKPNPKRPKGK